MKRDNTIPIAIAITIAVLIIAGIVIGVSCKEQFKNATKNIGLFKNIEIPEKKDATSKWKDSIFNKWKERISQKKKVTPEEARERWNKMIDNYSEFLKKPIESLPASQQKQRKAIEEKMSKEEFEKVVNRFHHINQLR